MGIDMEIKCKNLKKMRDGEMERWRDGEMERWRDGGMERWRDGGMWLWEDREWRIRGMKWNKIQIFMEWDNDGSGMNETSSLPTPTGSLNESMIGPIQSLTKSLTVGIQQFHLCDV